MVDLRTFGIFVTAAFILAISPGPGILYVLTRSIRGGRSEGLASAVGTGMGGMVHVFAAAFGLSALLAASAEAYMVIKYAGAAYLIYLGIRTLVRREEIAIDGTPQSGNARDAVRQGIITEALNPKTGLFFLAFIPQFINPGGSIFMQFVFLGCVSVFLNTCVDFTIALLAGPIGAQLAMRPWLRKGQRFFSGAALIGLGAYVVVENRN